MHGKFSQHDFNCRRVLIAGYDIHSRSSSATKVLDVTLFARFLNFSTPFIYTFFAPRLKEKGKENLIFEGNISIFPVRPFFSQQSNIFSAVFFSFYFCQTAFFAHGPRKWNFLPTFSYCTGCVYRLPTYYPSTHATTSNLVIILMCGC